MGQALNNNTRQIHLANPASKLEWVNFNQFTIINSSIVKDDKIKSIKPLNDEISVAKHSDSDGVVDFDEKKRFKPLKLKFKKTDSDGDGENDKIEIKKYYNVK